MTHDALWNKTKEKLKETLPDHAFNTWFEPISAIAYANHELVLEVPNQFFFEWLKSHYQKALESIVHKEAQENVSIKYTVSTTPKDSPSQWSEPSEARKPPATPQPALNKKYTFSSFIDGSNSQFAKAAALSVAEMPGQQQFNPLVIYGGVGLGKTHLLHAIGNHIGAAQKKINIVMAPSEKFTRDFITSIRKNKNMEFARHYRRADVLLIDDIQFFQGKEQTQEQFFHTFNELFQAGKQIVMTADRYPGELAGLMDRLLSRFESGLSVDIQPPNFETRVAILMEKSEENGLELPYDQIEFIATHVKASVRDLESTIIRLLAYSSLSNKEIDPALIKKVVKERLGRKLLTELTIEDIVRRVSETTRIGERDIVGTSRKKEIATARHMAVYLIREILKTPLTTIGLHFGGRDHSTVLHACRTMEKNISEGTPAGKSVQALRQQMLMSVS